LTTFLIGTGLTCWVGFEGWIIT